METSATYLSDLLPDILEDFAKKGKQAKYFNDVTLWAKDHLGQDLWPKQTEIADDLATGTKKSVAVRAGHGVGKSYLAGIVSCWWIDTRPIQFVFLASTAPSADQVGAILWREIRRFHTISGVRHREYEELKKLGKDTGNLPDHQLPGYITMDNKWRDDMGNLIGQGRKPPDNKEDSFQGIHAEYVLAIGDEACGLGAGMIDDLSNITSNAKSRRFLIGNPTNPRSYFGTIFSDTPNTDGILVKDAWSLHHISVLDSPNFHGADRCECHKGEPLGFGLSPQALSSLTDQSYVAEKIAEYGEDSARYKARVLGEFAYDSGNTLFDDFDIGRARDAKAYTSDRAKVVLGVDVARSKNGDLSFVYSFTTGSMFALDPITTAPLHVTETAGGKLRKIDSWKGVPLVDRYEIDGKLTVGQATLIHQHAIELGATEVRVDAGGLGGGLIDGLMFLSRNAYQVIEMFGGGATPDVHKWWNNRAFQYDQMRERFFRGEIDIDPADQLLIAQLEDILVEYKDPHGSLLIESKDSMKKRGAKSPDAADAAWYACADLTHLTDGVLAGKRPGDVLTYDPFEILNGNRSGYPI